MTDNYKLGKVDEYEERLEITMKMLLTITSCYLLFFSGLRFEVRREMWISWSYAYRFFWAVSDE